MGGEGSGDVVGHEFRGNQWTSGASATSIAKQRLDRARKIEPKLTETIKSVAERTGGKPVDLEFRLKSESSLLRKISKDSYENRISPEKAAEKITDLNRYTIVYDSDNFVDRVITAQKELEKKGYKKYEDKYRKYYREGLNYRGYNTVMVNSEGDIIEIQYHTPEGVNTKHKNTPLYDKFRLSRDIKERYKLHKMMVGLQNNIIAPIGWKRLEGVEI